MSRVRQPFLKFSIKKKHEVPQTPLEAARQAFARGFSGLVDAMGADFAAQDAGT